MSGLWREGVVGGQGGRVELGGGLGVAQQLRHVAELGQQAPVPCHTTRLAPAVLNTDSQNRTDVLTLRREN